MPTRFFAKELPDQPIYIAGRPYKFDFLATDDNWLISEFESAIRQGVGGIVEINQAQYDESLKKKTGNSSPQLFQRATEINPFRHAQAARPVVVVGDSVDRTITQPLGPAEPIAVTPPKVFLPKVGKPPTK